MYFENTGLEGLQVDLNLLEEIMLQHGLVRGGHWDYERITFDKKYVIKEGTYYLRVFGFTIDGDIGAQDAMITMKKPVVGKHYYPHGVEYGENEHFPDHLVKACTETLQAVKNDLAAFEIKA